MRRLLPLLSLLLLLPLLAAAPAEAGEGRSWRGLDVPYLSGGKLHFRGNAAREPYADPDLATSLITVAATRTSAILQADEHTLFELPARRGDLYPLTDALVGIPMADPAGDWVFWTVKRGSQVRLMAYDTRRNHVEGGRRLGRHARVWAVDGATAYVSTGSRYVAWTPRRAWQPLTVDADQLFLSDADDGRLVLNDLDDEVGNVRVVGADGATVAELSDAVGDTLDPTGRFLALWGGAVWDLTADEAVPLRLGRRWEAVHQSWSPSGVLVVIAQDPRPDRYERNPARRFVCDPATAACDRLPDPAGVRRYTVEHEFWPSSALVQLGMALGADIGS